MILCSLRWWGSTDLLREVWVTLGMKLVDEVASMWCWFLLRDEL